MGLERVNFEGFFLGTRVFLSITKALWKRQFGIEWDNGLFPEEFRGFGRFEGAILLQTWDLIPNSLFL